MPNINVRAKGANGEREIADDLNWIVYSAMKDLGMEPTMQSIQRNQNQSAVGGADLTGTFNMAIEVKRQEALSINTWWAQCVASAARRNEVPVLLYRQNRGKWRCVTNMEVPLRDVSGNVYGATQVRAEMDYESFKAWFKEQAWKLINGGWEVKV